MSSPEEKAYEIMRELDVDYVLVIFGGLTGYSSDGKCWDCHEPLLLGVAVSLGLGELLCLSYLPY